MRKLRVIGLAAVAVFVFAAISSASASAEVALWLANGNDIGVLTNSQATGELLLENVIPLIGTIDVLCSGIFDGSVGANGEDEVTKVLNLAGVEEKPLKCAVHATTNASLCANNEEAKVEPIHLPWVSQLNLVEPASIKDQLGVAGAGKEPGYTVECVTTKSKNECEGVIFGTATNVTGGVELVNASEEAKTCSLGKGFSEGSGLETLENGETLTVSDP
jgi:hypothetical protein